jgi:hypothetical protein
MFPAIGTDFQSLSVVLAEMIRHLRSVITTSSSKTPLSHDERNLFSVAYKNLVTPRRTSLRVITYIHDREVRKGNGRAVKLCELEQERVREEVIQTCEEVVQVGQPSALVLCRRGLSSIALRTAHRQTSPL